MSLFLFTILYGLHLDPFLKHNGAPCSDTQFPLEALRGLFNRTPAGVSVQRLASQRKEEPQHQVILQSLLISHCWSYFLWYLNSKADFLPAFALLFRCKRHTRSFRSFLFPLFFVSRIFLNYKTYSRPTFLLPYPQSCSLKLLCFVQTMTLLRVCEMNSVKVVFLFLICIVTL